MYKRVNQGAAPPVMGPNVRAVEAFRDRLQAEGDDFTCELTLEPLSEQALIVAYRYPGQETYRFCGAIDFVRYSISESYLNVVNKGEFKNLLNANSTLSFMDLVFIEKTADGSFVQASSSFDRCFGTSALLLGERYLLVATAQGHASFESLDDGQIVIGSQQRTQTVLGSIDAQGVHHPQSFEERTPVYHIKGPFCFSPYGQLYSESPIQMQIGQGPILTGKLAKHPGVLYLQGDEVWLKCGEGIWLTGTLMALPSGYITFDPSTIRGGVFGQEQVGFFHGFWDVDEAGRAGFQGDVLANLEGCSILGPFGHYPDRYYFKGRCQQINSKVMVTGELGCRDGAFGFVGEIHEKGFQYNKSGNANHPDFVLMQGNYEGLVTMDCLSFGRPEFGSKLTIMSHQRRSVINGLLVDAPHGTMLLRSDAGYYQLSIAARGELVRPTQETGFSSGDWVLQTRSEGPIIELSPKGQFVIYGLQKKHFIPHAHSFFVQLLVIDLDDDRFLYGACYDDNSGKFMFSGLLKSRANPGDTLDVTNQVENLPEYFDAPVCYTRMGLDGVCIKGFGGVGAQLNAIRHLHGKVADQKAG